MPVQNYEEQTMLDEDEDSVVEVRGNMTVMDSMLDAIKSMLEQTMRVSERDQAGGRVMGSWGQAEDEEPLGRRTRPYLWGLSRRPADDLNLLTSSPFRFSPCAGQFLP